MNEFTRSLLYVALLVCVPIVTACIKKGIAVAVDAINAQTQNIKVQRLVRENRAMPVAKCRGRDEPDLRQRPQKPPGRSMRPSRKKLSCGPCLPL